MARKAFEKAEKGSQKWIQELVNFRTEEIDDKIRTDIHLNDSEKIIWRSPLTLDDYAEYSDRDFLDLLHIKLDNRQLETFWPLRGGPQWDALRAMMYEDFIGAALRSNHERRRLWTRRPQGNKLCDNT